MEGWKVFPLGDLVDPKRGISYGIVQPGEHAPSGIPIVRVSDLKGDRVDKGKPLRVATSVEAPFSKTRLRGGELIMSIVGTVGQTAIVDESLVGWNVARAVAVIPVVDEIGAYWVKLSLKGGPARNHIGDRLNTTVQATLNLRDLVSLPIVVPPLDERLAIAATLGALDDKIELNRRMCETLETMARALFRDWFVDFGPTRAKMAGTAPYLDADLWSLFPDRLDDDGKPEGWKESMLGSFTRIKNGYAFKSSDWTTEGSPVVKIGSVKPGIVDLNQVSFVSEYTSRERADFRIPIGSMLVGLTGYVGETGRVPPCTRLPLLNQRVGMFEPDEACEEFVFTCVRMPSFKQHAEEAAHGSAQANVSTKDLLRFPLINAGRALTAMFGVLTKPFLDAFLANLAESEALAKTRDLLLPRLMSGELRVADAERPLEEVL